MNCRIKSHKKAISSQNFQFNYLLKSVAVEFKHILSEKGNQLVYLFPQPYLKIDSVVEKGYENKRVVAEVITLGKRY